MTVVDFKEYPFRYEQRAGVKHIYDVVRRGYYVLTPEEWVRQNILHYLIELGHSASLIAVEKKIMVNGRARRFDIVVYDSDTKPHILVECKAQSESIDDHTLMQIAAYNLSLQAKYLWLSNGAVNYYIDLAQGLLLPHIN